MKSIFKIPHSFTRKKSRSMNKQQGNMLFISIFTILILGFLGLSLTSIIASTADSVVYETLGIKALNAARSGLEAKVAEQFPLSGGTARCDGTGESPLNSPTSFSSVTGFEGCSYSASCESVSGLPSGVEYYRFSSLGQCDFGDVVVSRTVAVDAGTGF